MTKNITKKKDDRWYETDDINLLLQHYFAVNPNVEILTALLGTDWQGEEGSNNTLKANLQSFQQQRLLASSPTKNKVIVPVNLNNDHWVLLYILYQEKNQYPATVYYFDPFGHAINDDVNQAINDAFPTAEIVNTSARVQSDGYNCGPWIIEAARALVNSGAEPNGNIRAAREEHQQILAQLSNGNRIANTGLKVQTNSYENRLPTLRKEEISPRIKALADAVFEDTSATEEKLSNLKIRVKESDQLLRNQCRSFKDLDKIEQSLTGLNKDLISEKYLTDSKVDEEDDADYLLARALQNAEISDFLSSISRLKHPSQPYLSVKPTSCTVEAAKQSITDTKDSIPQRGF